jgi:hypothetical protein
MALTVAEEPVIVPKFSEKKNVAVLKIGSEEHVGISKLDQLRMFQGVILC